MMTITESDAVNDPRAPPQLRAGRRRAAEAAVRALSACRLALRFGRERALSGASAFYVEAAARRRSAS